MMGGEKEVMGVFGMNGDEDGWEDDEEYRREIEEG